MKFLLAVMVLGVLAGVPMNHAAAQPRPDMRISDARAQEGSDIVFTVEVSGPHPGLSVDYTTVDGSGSAGFAYEATSGTLNISANQQTSRVEIRVPTIDNELFDPGQTFALHLSNTFANLVKPTGEGTIVNDEALPEVNIRTIGKSATVTEPDPGGVADAVFFVVASHSGLQPITVSYRTETPPVEGRLSGAAADFEAVEGQIVIEPGDQFLHQIRVRIIPDLMHEADETFRVTLFDPINARLGNREQVGTIVNNDQTPSVSIQDVTIPEGDALKRVVRLPVELSNPTDQDVTYTVSTRDLTAVAGSDFIHVTDGTSNTMLAGQTSTTVEIIILGDDRIEPQESLLVILDTPTNAVLADRVAELTINDDDDISIEPRVP